MDVVPHKVAYQTLTPSNSTANLAVPVLLRKQAVDKPASCILLKCLNQGGFMKRVDSMQRERHHDNTIQPS